MKRKQLWKAGTAILLASAMLMTSVPVTTRADESTTTSVADTALAYYDFADFSVPESDSSKLTDADNREIVLEGSGTKPSLITDDTRGQVLSLTEQSYANRAYALLPENPFAGESVEDGFTVNFWTKTTGTAGGGKCLLDFELAPATTAEAENGTQRAGTLAINQQMTYWNTTGHNKKFMDFNTGNLGLSEKTWKMVTVTMTTDGITFYSNGEKISHTVTGSYSIDYNQMINDLAGTGGIGEPSDTNVRLGASLATYWSCAGALMDDVSFYGKELSAYEVGTLYEETVLPNVDLESVAITGESSVEEGKSIQLSKSVTPENTTAKATVWESSDKNILVVDDNGKVTGINGGTATVTATVGGVKSDPFQITVIDLVDSLDSGYYLTVYSTTTNFYAYTANIEQETQSVYFAVSKDGKNFEVLNNGGGVIFSSNTEGTLCIKDPKVYKDDGKFVVVAPDATASKGIHIFTSEDGVNYTDDTLVSETAYTSLALKKTDFTLMLDGENILETDENITLGNAVELTEEEYTYIVNKLGTVVNTGLEALDTWNVKTTDTVTEEALSKQYPSVNATYSDGSTQKFNIDWSGALSNVDLTKEGTYTVTGKVDQTKYLNNLKELNGSTLPEDDPANVGDEADNYDEESKTNYYDATKYVEGMADPCIYWDEQTGYYYMTGSYFPEDGDEIDEKDSLNQYDRVVLRRAKTLEGLQNRSAQVTIWKVGNQGYDDNGKWQTKGYRYIWAPEIHRVGDYWVIYFTESHSSNAYDIYCHALILDGSVDPYETALTSSDGESEWLDYKMCVSSSQYSDPFSTAFCLDMTYFKDEVNEKSYVIWAGKPTAAYQGNNTDLFIATVDENEPWKITSNAIRVTKADYGWERVRYCVNEGATVLQKDGKIFMCYSASGTGSEYAIGMCSAENGADLLDAASWTKSPYPLLTSRDVDGEEGPGHNSFTVDKDGNVIFVYHARPTSHNDQHCGWDGSSSTYNSDPLNDPCRHARLKRVHWAADGTPILKMTYEEELTEANSTVTATIVVTKGTVAGPDNNNGGGTGDAQKNPVAVSSVKLNKTKITLGVKETFALKATVTPSDAANQTVTWTSSKPKIATVSQSGKIKALKKGTTTITATVDGKKVTCKVTVKTAPKKITLNAKSKTLKKGKTFQIKVKLPKNTASYKITYTSSKSKVATVSSTGKVTAKKKGTATITVKTFNGKKAKLKIKVN